MIHLHTEHQDGFIVLMHYGVKNWSLDAIHGDKVSWNVYNTCVNWYLSHKGDMVHWIMYSLSQCVYIVFDFFYFFVLVSFLVFFLFEILWVYLLKTLTRPHSSTWATKNWSLLICLSSLVLFFILILVCLSWNAPVSFGCWKHNSLWVTPQVFNGIHCTWTFINIKT